MKLLLFAIFYFVGTVSSECGEEALESLALVYKPVQQDSKRVLGIACQGAIVPGKHQNYTDTVLVSSYCIVEDPQEGYVVSVGSPDPHGDFESSAQKFRAQRILNFPFEQHPVGILKTPQPIMYSDTVKPMCIADVPLPDEHVCILGVLTQGGLMTLRHMQMLYESDCEPLAEGLSTYLCGKVKEIDADVGETFGLDPSLDIYPFVAPLEFDISGVKPGSMETPLFCLTNEHPTWSVYGFVTNAFDVADPESPILFSDIPSDLAAIKQHSDISYQEWMETPLFCLTNEHPTWSVYGFVTNAFDVTDPESPILFSDIPSDLAAIKQHSDISYQEWMSIICLETPLPDEHVCILGVVTKGGLMTLRHVQMLYESDCEQLAEGNLCAKVKEIDAEVGETFGLDPSLDIYPFVAPLEFDISGVQSGSLETPLFCLTNEHPTWSVYGFAMNAYDVTDPESPILFSDVSSDLKAIKQHSDVTYQEWVQSMLAKRR
ncbi:hypothetical protein T11_6443 [Trichinella zimbabwensis]|uniref:Peptidase S1 domain-containing protein n=1 Tax=Trichinella zimbabwensis TaxID=268475 RepID=A0A0V1I2F1_9BILA|nr:hypothetical protein T11_6443 [Trichinella zimbabwensis]